MTEQIVELKQRLVVGRKRDGRNCYDPQAKRELIEACLQPGVSAAKLALTHGVNANQLRTWVQASASIVDGRFLAGIRSDAGAIYSGRDGQRSTLAHRASGTDGPAPQWRSTGMVGVARRSTGAGPAATLHAAMFRIDSGLKVFLHRDAVDGRKNINGLALLLEQGLGLDPLLRPRMCSATADGTGSRSCSGIATDSGCSSSDWNRIASNGPRSPTSLG